MIHIMIQGAVCIMMIIIYTVHIYHAMYHDDTYGAASWCIYHAVYHDDTRCHNNNYYTILYNEKYFADGHFSCNNYSPCPNLEGMETR